ncbi:MAG TPA: hypothetical protein VI408_02505 [Gaiellaceae bacterium]
MRTKLTLTIVGLVSLVATSVAVAHGIEGAKTAKAVAAQFTAATVTNVTSRTCTTSDSKTIVVTDGTYTGTATGDTDLAGPITLHARSVVNTTDNVGTVMGAFKIDTAGDGSTRGAFTGVLSGTGLAGFGTARAHGGSAVLGNLSATFSPTTGFAPGSKIGGGTSGGNAVEIGSGSCRPAHQTAEHSSARGTVSAISTTSITVAGLTCALPSDKAADINAKVKQGDSVEIECSLQNGTNTLVKIEGKHHH